MTNYCVICIELIWLKLFGNKVFRLQPNRKTSSLAKKSDRKKISSAVVQFNLQSLRLIWSVAHLNLTERKWASKKMEKVWWRTDLIVDTTLATISNWKRKYEREFTFNQKKYSTETWQTHSNTKWMKWYSDVCYASHVVHPFVLSNGKLIASISIIIQK